MPPILAHSLPSDWRPVIGPHLGDLTDELAGDTIVEFCSGGAKQYGLKVHKSGAAANEYNYILKIRGITLNYSVLNEQDLRYETFKKSVLDYARTGKAQYIHVRYPRFLRPSVAKLQVFRNPSLKFTDHIQPKASYVPKHYVSSILVIVPHNYMQQLYSIYPYNQKFE